MMRAVLLRLLTTELSHEHIGASNIIMLAIVMRSKELGM